MNRIVELTLENFQEIAVQGSMERPVVIEFYSERSQASKQMGLALATLSKEMNFVLGRVDTDKDQQIAGYFRVTSIPDARVVSQGQMVEAIQGALTEPLLRKRLAKHFLSPTDLLLIEAESLLQQGLPDAALPIIEELLAASPTSKKLQYCKSKALVDLGRGEDARTLLNGFHEGDDFFREARALSELMAFHIVCSQAPSSDPVEQSYRNACSQALQGEYRAALDELLVLVETQPKWNEGAARKAMLTLFGVMGAKHELTWEYRAKLNRILFI